MLRLSSILRDHRPHRSVSILGRYRKRTSSPRLYAASSSCVSSRERTLDGSILRYTSSKLCPRKSSVTLLTSCRQVGHLMFLQLFNSRIIRLAEYLANHCLMQPLYQLHSLIRYTHKTRVRRNVKSLDYERVLCRFLTN